MPLAGFGFGLPWGAPRIEFRRSGVAVEGGRLLGEIKLGRTGSSTHCGQPTVDQSFSSILGNVCWFWIISATKMMLPTQPRHVGQWDMGLPKRVPEIPVIYHHRPPERWNLDHPSVNSGIPHFWTNPHNVCTYMLYSYPFYTIYTIVSPCWLVLQSSSFDGKIMEEP